MPVMPVRLTRVCLYGIFAFSLLSAPNFGQEKPSAEPKKKSEGSDTKEKKSESDKDAPKKETIVITKHSIVIDGKTVAYEAMAGMGGANGMAAPSRSPAFQPRLVMPPPKCSVPSSAIQLAVEGR